MQLGTMINYTVSTIHIKVHNIPTGKHRARLYFADFSFSIVRIERTLLLLDVFCHFADTRRLIKYKSMKVDLDSHTQTSKHMHTRVSDIHESCATVGT